MEKALRENDRSRWPLIIVHFDVKDNRPELHRAVWGLLGEYEGWITTARKTADPHELAPFDPKPLLVLTEDNDAQEQVFFKDAPVGANLRVFGSAHTRKLPGASDAAKAHAAATFAPEALISEKPTDHRRRWNNSWWEVEEGSQRKASEWTAADDNRLRALVSHAHALGFWIRFYTLDGSREAAKAGSRATTSAPTRRRWRAGAQRSKQAWT